MRAQEKRLAKFPIKMKVEDLVAYVIQQNWGNVAASVEIMPQILATKEGKYRSSHALTLGVHPNRPALGKKESEQCSWRPRKLTILLSLILPLVPTPSPNYSSHPATSAYPSSHSIRQGN